MECLCVCVFVYLRLCWIVIKANQSINPSIVFFVFRFVRCDGPFVSSFLSFVSVLVVFAFWIAFALEMPIRSNAPRRRRRRTRALLSKGLWLQLNGSLLGFSPLFLSPQNDVPPTLFVRVSLMIDWPQQARDWPVDGRPFVVMLSSHENPKNCFLFWSVRLSKSMT